MSGLECDKAAICLKALAAAASEAADRADRWLDEKAASLAKIADRAQKEIVDTATAGEDVENDDG